MKDLPTERVLFYRIVDLTSGIPQTQHEVAFVNIPQEAFDWREIGSLQPDTVGKYKYVQSSNWPYPPIDGYILRTIADRIDTLNSRAKANQEKRKQAGHPTPVL